MRRGKGKETSQLEDSRGRVGGASGGTGLRYGDNEFYLDTRESEGI